MAPIYRAPMRSRELEVSPFAGARYGVAEGLVGIGGSLPEPPDDLGEAVEILTVTSSPKAGRMLGRFASLPAGTPVWTRVGEEAFRAGRIAGPWDYDDSEDAYRVGIHHVRPALWLPQEIGADDVPAAVAATFARGGRNMQRIHDAEAEYLTERLLERNQA